VMLREPCSPEERAAMKAGVKANSSAGVVALVGDRIREEVVEVFYVLGLDGRNNTLFLNEVSRGGRSALGIMPADIYRIPCATNASAIVLVHNHPSGDPMPSPEDLALTKRLVEAGNMIGIPIVDHIIITPDGRYSSLLDLGVFG